MTLTINLVQPLSVYRGKNRFFNAGVPQSDFLYIAVDLLQVMQHGIGYFRIIATAIGFFNGCFIDNPVIPPQILAVFVQPRAMRLSGRLRLR